MSATPSSQADSRTRAGMGSSLRVRGKVIKRAQQNGTEELIHMQILCKDLWTLHLSMLPEAVPDEAYQEKGQEIRESDEGGVGVDNEGPKCIYDYDDEEEPEADSELEALLKENSDFSSSDSEDDEGEAKKMPESMKWVKDKRRHARLSYETPVNTIAVLVVACWMLRIPVMYQDFTR